jgi:hypothetical protein
MIMIIENKAKKKKRNQSIQDSIEYLTNHR